MTKTLQEGKVIYGESMPTNKNPVGEATAEDTDCCREVVETRSEGQQVTSMKARFNAVSSPAMLKLERLADGYDMHAHCFELFVSPVTVRFSVVNSAFPGFVLRIDLKGGEKSMDADGSSGTAKVPIQTADTAVLCAAFCL